MHACSRVLLGTTPSGYGSDCFALPTLACKRQGAVGDGAVETPVDDVSPGGLAQGA